MFQIKFRPTALTLVLAVVFGTAFADTSPEPHDVFGVYATVDKDSHITISDCGDGSPCGRITWVDPTTLKPGETPENISSKDGRPILGLLMLSEFERRKRDWRAGTIYDPEEDKTYTSRLKRLEDGTLQVKGCIGPFCQTQIWTSVAE